MAENIEEKMFAHVKNWPSSGMSKSAYARSNGLAEHVFRYWFDKYQKINAKKQDTPGFIKLNPFLQKKETAPIDKAKQTNHGKLEIELNLPSGLCLKIYS